MISDLTLFLESFIRRRFRDPRPSASAAPPGGGSSSGSGGICGTGRGRTSLSRRFHRQDPLEALKDRARLGHPFGKDRRRSPLGRAPRHDEQRLPQLGRRDRRSSAQRKPLHLLLHPHTRKGQNIEGSELRLLLRQPLRLLRLFEQPPSARQHDDSA